MTKVLFLWLVALSLLFYVLAQEVFIEGDFECVGEGCFGGPSGPLKYSKNIYLFHEKN